MAPTRVVLMSCGSYNPPTNMHLRMFEIARDHLHRMGTHIVVGGVISPVHDAYGKKELASGTHRCAMLQLALQNNDWIRVSTWETRRECWTKTKMTLQHHQNLLNSVVFDKNDIQHHSEMEDMEWIPENIRNSSDRTPIQIKLLCGADLLESFGTPGLWAEEDIDAIVGQHGLVVITREGTNPNRFIYDSDLLSKYMHNIHIVTEWITNEVSSTKIRRALKRGESIKYLLQDAVIDYVYKHGIYNSRRTSPMRSSSSSSLRKDCIPCAKRVRICKPDSSVENDMKRSFYGKLEELIATGGANLSVMTDARYVELIAETKEAKKAKSKGESLTSKQYRRLHRYDVLNLGDEERLIERKGTGLDIKYYCPAADLFSVIHEVHLNTGHKKGRGMERELKRKYCNVTRAVIKLYLDQCKQCVDKKQNRKSINSSTIQPSLQAIAESLCKEEILMEETEDDYYKYILACRDGDTKTGEEESPEAKPMIEENHC